MQCVGWIPLINLDNKKFSFISDNSTTLSNSIRNRIKSNPFIQKEISISECDDEKALIIYVFNDSKPTIVTNIFVYEIIENNYEPVIDLQFGIINNNGLFYCSTYSNEDDSFKKDLMNIIFRDFEESFSSLKRPIDITPLIFDGYRSSLPDEKTLINDIYSIYIKNLNILLEFINQFNNIEQSNLNENFLRKTIIGRRNFLCTAYSAQIFLNIFENYFNKEDYRKFKIYLDNEIDYVNSICESLKIIYSIENTRDIKSVLHNTDLLSLFILLSAVITILIDIFRNYAIELFIVYIFAIILFFIVFNIRKKKLNSL